MVRNHEKERERKLYGPAILRNFGTKNQKVDLRHLCRPSKVTNWIQCILVCTPPHILRHLCRPTKVTNCVQSYGGGHKYHTKTPTQFYHLSVIVITVSDCLTLRMRCALGLENEAFVYYALEENFVRTPVLEQLHWNFPYAHQRSS